MLFKYKVLDRNSGTEKNGVIEAHSKDVAISSLQDRGFYVISVVDGDKKSFLEQNVFLGKVKNKDIVILSKQLATLFDAQVSALKIFELISVETKNENLKNALVEIAADIADGSSVNKALAKQSHIFSSFYINMVAAGEESGKLSETFIYLSDYLDRSYEISSKAKTAFIYPAFVISVFIIVIYLMLTMVIPNIAGILIDSGQDLPLPTVIILALSSFMTDYGIYLIIILIIGAISLFRYSKSAAGKYIFDEFKIKIPYIGSLYKNLYYSRISGNLNLMLSSGVAMVKSLENTAKIVDNKIYEDMLMEIAEDVRGGASVSNSFMKGEKYIPSLLIQMIKVGEETGKLSDILKTMSKFYEREVLNSVNSLVSLIEPALIVALGVGVGGMLSAVLIPIYSITGTV